MIDSISIEIRFEIKARRERVWEALVAETSQWWRKEYFATKNPTGIYLELRPGGRLFEESGDGGMLWYTVIELAPPSVLALSGNLAPPYGGPATSLLRLEFTEKGPNCAVKLTDHIFGVVNQKTKETIESGWRVLFVKGLKPYLENAD